MIPLGDTNDAKRLTPIVNYALIIINIFVFVFYERFGVNQAFIASFSTIPQEIISGQDVVFEDGYGNTPIPVYATIFTSMFMHGSLMHLGGNMLYLWIFGDNLENQMGHVKYLAFYLLTGIIASLAHVLLSTVTGKGLLIPCLGASGAISGVLGGYMVLFPKNEVRMLAFVMVIRVPAFITLGLWIAMQIWQGAGSLYSEGGGVAYGAHVGGFIAGLLLVKFFGKRATENS